MSITTCVLSDPAAFLPQVWADGPRGLRLTHRSLSLMALIVAVLIPYDLLITGHTAHAVIEGLALATLLGVNWVMRVSVHKRIELAKWTGTLSVAAVIIVMAINGRSTDGVLIWAALFPPLPFFIFGIRRGLLTSALFSLLVVGLLATSILAGEAPGYSWLAVVNAGGALALSTTVAFLCERIRSDNARCLAIAANTDPLTGVTNRRGFLAGFECRRALVERAQKAMSLLVFDVDHLKHINDEHGHSAGDAAIRHVATLVRGQVRSQDLLGRLGGDEFALLLPGTGLDGAMQVAAKLRKALRAQPLHFAGRFIPVTLSIGAAESSPPSADFDTLFAAADRQLYVAKQSGRDHHLGVSVSDLLPAVLPGLSGPEARRVS